MVEYFHCLSCGWMGRECVLGLCPVCGRDSLEVDEVEAV